MDPGTLEMQVFVSLIVVLATAFVALVCDYLKGSNESLRERNIELLVRRETQQQMRSYETLDWLQRWVGAANGGTWQEDGAGRQNGKSNPVYTTLKTAPVVSARTAKRTEAAEEKPAATVQQTANLLQSLAIPDWVRKEQQARAMARKADDAGSAVKDTPAIEHLVREEHAAGPVKVNKPRVALPAGFHGRDMLSSLLKESKKISGVVVSLGINDAAVHGAKLGDAGMKELVEAVEGMLQGMLRAGVDFGCCSSEEEYLLVFQDEHGVEAQRRLTTISELLWGFQLRSVPTASSFFAWGAVEVMNEPVADAVASASERMHQARRNRKTIPLDGRRKAVNA